MVTGATRLKASCTRLLRIETMWMSAAKAYPIMRSVSYGLFISVILIFELHSFLTAPECLRLCFKEFLNGTLFVLNANSTATASEFSVYERRLYGIWENVATEKLSRISAFYAWSMLWRLPRLVTLNNVTFCYRIYAERGWLRWQPVTLYLHVLS
jgi:hypothetical protein